MWRHKFVIDYTGVGCWVFVVCQGFLVDCVGKETNASGNPIRDVKPIEFSVRMRLKYIRIFITKVSFHDASLPGNKRSETSKH